VGDRVVANIRFSARIKGTDPEMTLDYSQLSLIEDGKITNIKEFREHDDALAYAEASERGGSDVSPEHRVNGRGGRGAPASRDKQGAPAAAPRLAHRTSSESRASSCVDSRFRRRKQLRRGCFAQYRRHAGRDG
jgi:hypothetical protein